MTLLQKLQIKAARLRQKLNALAAEADPTPEQRSEMDSLSEEYEVVEQRMIAATIGDGAAGDPPGEPEPVEPDAEGRELRGLIEGASVGEIFDAAVERRSIDGATRELQQHFDLGPNQVPLDLLRMERRDVTPGIEAGVTEAETLQPVFASGTAAFLGVAMPTVPVGVRSYPVLTTRASVKGPHTDSTTAAETTGAFTANELSPSRIQASFFYRRTDAARFRGLDSALREALSSSLMEKHDREIIIGASGLLGGTNLTADDTSGVDDFESFLSRWGHGRVDGRWANSLADLRIVVGAATYGHMGAVYQTSGELSAADALASKTAGVRVTAHGPAVASDKQDGIVRLGMRADAVSPIWEGVTLIPDEITQAAKGEIRITAVMLYAMKIIRAGGFKRVTSKHA